MALRFKIGLKLHSTDTGSIPDVLQLRTGTFDFIELYVVPGSFGTAADAWKELDVPYIIHAPHSFHGVNFAQANKWKTNLGFFNEARVFADDLSSDVIVVHGGNNGSIEETIRQITRLEESRIVLENKPKVGLNGEECVGWSYEELVRAMGSSAVSGIALDLAHAACTACSTGVPVRQMLDKLVTLDPKIFHLADGDSSSEEDVHLNLGKGDLDIGEFVSLVPRGALVTLETPRRESGGLGDFLDDVRFLKGLVGCRKDG